MDKTDEIRRINLELSMKFGKIEVHLKHAKNIAGLFETLITGVEKEFGIPFVWLTLIDKENTVPVIAAIKSSRLLEERISVVSQSLFEQIISDGRAPVLANKDLQLYYKLLPPTNKYFVRSMAVIPFKVQNEVVGSWNNGDVANDRFTPEMDTGLLQRLGQNISQRLTELVVSDK